MYMQRVLSCALLIGSFHAVGCADGVEEEELVTGEAARDPAAVPSTPEEVASAAAEPACDAQRFDFQVTGDPDLDATAAEEAVSLMRPEGGEANDVGERAEAQACGVDYYFHPNNGMHGGWINSTRLCYEGYDSASGMSKFRICTGGYAPVRFWNPESCNGTIHNWYPQGWSGLVRSGGGCC